MANYGATPPKLVLFITAATRGQGTVTGSSFSEAYTVAPDEITTVAIPSSAVVTTADGGEPGGIRITANTEIVVYGLNQEA